MKLKGHTDNVKALLLNRDGTQVCTFVWGKGISQNAEISLAFSVTILFSRLQEIA